MYCLMLGDRLVLPRNPRPWLAAVFALSCLSCLFCVRPAFAIVYLSSAAQTAGLGASNSFLNGEAELIVSLSDGSEVGCSGSLVDGGSYVLTAAHCVTGDSGTLTANNINLDFASVGLSVSATRYIVNPTWNGSITNGGDLALIKLNSAITSIASYSLYTSKNAVGDIIVVAGYGNTSTTGTGYINGTFGTLRFGANGYIGTYSDVSSVYAYELASGGPDYVGSDEAMIAPGDSGGASLVDVDGTWQIVGVHDFITCETAGCTPDSSLGQYGGDTSVYADQAWLDSVLAPEPGSLVLVGTGLLGLVAANRRRAVNSDRGAVIGRNT